jgi:hypothetical protein
MKREMQYDGLPAVVMSIIFFGVFAIIGIFFVINYYDVFIKLPDLKTSGGDFDKLKDAAAIWGQYGDYIGGVLNPTIGFLTVILLVITVIMQRMEMKNANIAFAEQSAQFELQRFEQTFFSWLNSYRELVNSISTQDTGQIGAIYVSGRNALQFWKQKNFSDYFFLEENKILIEEQFDDQLIRGDLTRKLETAFRENFKSQNQLSSKDWDLLGKTTLALWEKTYEDSEIHIDSMFRTLYRLLRFIDEQPIETISDTAKWQYVSIVRAQLSFIEMEFLFYNGFTLRGENFVPYVNKYALFDNFFPKKNKYFEILKNSELNPYQSSAFDSELARAV